MNQLIKDHVVECLYVLNDEDDRLRTNLLIFYDLLNTVESLLWQNLILLCLLLQRTDITVPGIQLGSVHMWSVNLLLPACSILLLRLRSFCYLRLIGIKQRLSLEFAHQFITLAILNNLGALIAFKMERLLLKWWDVVAWLVPHFNIPFLLLFRLTWFHSWHMNFDFITTFFLLNHQHRLVVSIVGKVEDQS